jgi:hypothetical protein
MMSRTEAIASGATECAGCHAVNVYDGSPLCTQCGEDAREAGARRIRLMRGQVVVRELDVSPSGVLWTPEAGPRQVKTHRGVVLGMGPPARLTEHPSSPEVPHGFEVGDVVQYHFAAVGTQAARTRAWTDGEPATWLCQPEIDAVWEDAS